MDDRADLPHSPYRLPADVVILALEIQSAFAARQAGDDPLIAAMPHIMLGALRDDQGDSNLEGLIALLGARDEGVDEPTLLSLLTWRERAVTVKWLCRLAATRKMDFGAISDVFEVMTAISRRTIDTGHD